jgi:hypothetical protein
MNEQALLIKTPPKTALSGGGRGHAELTDPRTASLGGHVRLSLYGTPDKPHLQGRDPDSFGSYDIRPRPAELVRFARELLAFLGEDDGTELPPWRPASDSTGTRPWFLCRYSGEDDERVPLADRYHFSGAGTLIRYASEGAAERMAVKLNKLDRAAAADDSTRALDAIAAVLSERYPSKGWDDAMEQRQGVIRVLQGTGRMS